jgi:hypothetical protein
VCGTLIDREFEGRPSLTRLTLTVLPADRHDWKELLHKWLGVNGFFLLVAPASTQSD